MKNLVRIAVLVSLLVTFRVIFSSSPLVGSDYPYISPEVAVESLHLPQTWKSLAGNMGEYAVSTLWAWPVNVLYGLFAKIGLDFWVYERALALLPILVLGYWGIKKLLIFEGIIGMAAELASLFYLANTYFLLVIDGGQLAIGLAYAWFPTVYLQFIKSLKEDLASKLIAGICITILGFFDIRFVYIFATLAFVRFIYDVAIFRGKDIRASLKSWVQAGLVTTLVLVGLNAYWILPAFFAKPPQLPTGYGRVMQTFFLNFTTISHSFFLVQPHWYKNIFGQVAPVGAEFVFIPILAYLSAIFIPRDRKVGFWLLASVVGIFLVKGSSPPFGQVYNWLFANIPGFYMFRDSTKFFFITALSYSVLIGFLFSALSKVDIKYKSVLPFVFISYIIFTIRPVWLGRMTGLLNLPRDTQAYSDLNNVIKADGSYGKVLWVPRRTPLGYSSDLHPNVETLELVEDRPFAASVVGTYELFNFLRRPYIGQLLANSGFRYLVYPFPDEAREQVKDDQKDYYLWFLRKLDLYDWTQRLPAEIPSFSIKQTKDRIYPFADSVVIVGSDDIYSKANQEILSERAYIFAEEYPGLLETILQKKSVKIVLNNKSQVDLAADLLPKEDLVFPAQFFDFSPNESGWWKRETLDLISWRGFLQQKYGIDNLDFDFQGGWAVAEGARDAFIPNSQKTNGKLLARVMFSSKGGRVSFYQNGSLVGSTDTKVDDNPIVSYEGGEVNGEVQTLNFEKSNFMWVEVGEYKANLPVQIKTEGDINVVNALAFASNDDWDKAVSRALSIVEAGQLAIFGEDSFDLVNPDDVRLSPSIKYQKLTPTHYKISVSDLENPTFIIFSEAYDKNWKLNEQGAVPVFSLVNGFWVEENGEYDLYYGPQRYVFPGLVIVVITMFATASAIMLRRKGRKKSNLRP